MGAVSGEPKATATRGAWLAALLALASCGGSPTNPAAPVPTTAPWDKPGWTLTFHDEFDGTALDTAAWSRRYHWGEAIINGELQAYVDDAFRVSDGVLSIVGERRAGRYAGQTLDYTSGVLASNLYQKYGWFEARLRLPAGRGYWPAFWLLGDTSINEIDAMEELGHEATVFYTTVHYGTDYATDHFSDGQAHRTDDLTAAFHVYAVEWDEAKLVWYLDGREVFRHAGRGVPQVPLYAIVNLAIGGGWPGPPDATTPFPGRLQVDYVRVYRKAP